METLIHTTEGTLVSFNPLRRRGTRGYHKFDKSYRFIITEECLRRDIRRKVGVRRGKATLDHYPIEWVGRKSGRPTTEIRFYPEDRLTIITEDNPEYFEVEGY